MLEMHRDSVQYQTIVSLSFYLYSVVLQRARPLRDGENALEAGCGKITMKFQYSTSKFISHKFLIQNLDRRSLSHRSCGVTKKKTETKIGCNRISQALAPNDFRPPGRAGIPRKRKGPACSCLASPQHWPPAWR